MLLYDYLPFVHEINQIAEFHIVVSLIGAF